MSASETSAALQLEVARQLNVSAQYVAVIPPRALGDPYLVEFNATQAEVPLDPQALAAAVNATRIGVDSQQGGSVETARASTPYLAGASAAAAATSFVAAAMLL